MLADQLLPVAGGYLRPCPVPETALMPVAGGFSRRLRCFIVALVLIVGRGLAAQAQQPATLAPLQSKAYTFVEQMPVYLKGGKEQAWISEVQRKVKLPLLCDFQPTKSRIIAEFIVPESGIVSEARIIEGIESRVDEEVLAAIRSLAPFQPGYHKGVAVKVKMVFSMIIHFQ